MISVSARCDRMDRAILLTTHLWSACAYGASARAAWSGWEAGVQQLLRLGAQVNASHNAGDRPWHWARNMGHSGVMALLEQVRGSITLVLHVYHVCSAWGHGRERAWD